MRFLHEIALDGYSDEAFMDVKAVAGIEFDEEDVISHKVKSRAAALEIFFAKGYNDAAALEVKQTVGFDLDEEALEALKALHTEDRVFMATFACFSPNDDVHALCLSQQQRCLTNTLLHGTPYAALQLSPPAFIGIRQWRMCVNRFECAACAVCRVCGGASCLTSCTRSQECQILGDGSCSCRSTCGGVAQPQRRRPPPPEIGR